MYWEPLPWEPSLCIGNLSHGYLFLLTYSWSLGAPSLGTYGDGRTLLSLFVHLFMRLSPPALRFAVLPRSAAGESIARYSQNGACGRQRSSVRAGTHLATSR